MNIQCNKPVLSLMSQKYGFHYPVHFFAGQRTKDSRIIWVVTGCKIRTVA
uniref:Uncharacterized protein n=1 Tax=Anguilla anguilla TaxID=7936 RepID=A0A0E9QSY6_ANGAN